MTNPEISPTPENRVPVTVSRELFDRIGMLRDAIDASEATEEAKAYILGRLVVEKLIDESLEGYLDGAIPPMLEALDALDS
jgi:hypothetical protein